MIDLKLYVRQEGDKPNPCSIYPLLQYPWPTPGVPKQHYYTEGEKESSMTEQQVIRQPEKFVTGSRQKLVTESTVQLLKLWDTDEWAFKTCDKHQEKEGKVK